MTAHHVWAPWTKGLRREREVSVETVLRLGPLNHFHGSCTDPVEIGLVSTFRNALNPTQSQRMHAGMSVRCRKCEACNIAFRSHWQHRSEQEIAIGRRARWLTLTFAIPHNEREAKDEMTRYLKRIRERHPDKPLTYAYVMERGKRATERLHIHAVIVEHGENISSRVFRQRKPTNPRGQWLAGQADVKDIRPDQATKIVRYLVKYMTKDAVRLPNGRRIQASNYWGLKRPRPTAPGEPQGPLMQGLLRGTVLPDTPSNAPKGDPALPRPTPRDRGDANAVTCAFTTKVPPAAATLERTTLARLRDWSTANGLHGCTFRVIPPDDIPPEIAERWFRPDTTTDTGTARPPDVGNPPRQGGQDHALDLARP